MILSRMTLKIMPFSIMILSRVKLYSDNFGVTLSIMPDSIAMHNLCNRIAYKKAFLHSGKCRSAACRFAECRGAFLPPFPAKN